MENIGIHNTLKKMENRIQLRGNLHYLSLPSQQGLALEAASSKTQFLGCLSRDIFFSFAFVKLHIWNFTSIK